LAKIVKLSALTPEAIRQIVNIYHNTLGGEMGKLYHEKYLLEGIKRDLQHISTSKWRFGSRFSEHSKLLVQKVYDSPFSNFENPVVKFEFYAGERNREGRLIDSDAERFSEAFENAVDQYLTNIGLAL